MDMIFLCGAANNNRKTDMDILRDYLINIPSSFSAAASSVTVSKGTSAGIEEKTILANTYSVAGPFTINKTGNINNINFKIEYTSTLTTTETETAINTSFGRNSNYIKCRWNSYSRKE